MGRPEGCARRLRALPEHLAERIRAGDERYVVTGATGWFGMATLQALHEVLGPAAFAARVDAYASRRRTFRLRDDTEITAVALSDLPARVDARTVLLHFAFLTKERGDEAGFLAANLAITGIVLSALERGPAGLLYLSSGAARGPADVEVNPYGLLKAVDERAMRQACADAGARCVVARVFNVSGPYMTKPELYALGDLIARARAGEPLRIRARGRVVRSYVLVTDIVAVGLAALLAPDVPSPVLFETAGEEVVEVGELATRVRQVLGRGEVPIEREFEAAAPPDVYVGDGERFRGLAHDLGVPLASLDEQIRLTAAGLPAEGRGYPPSS